MEGSGGLRGTQSAGGCLLLKAVEVHTTKRGRGDANTTWWLYADSWLSE
jgi:hypothetical protein